MRWLSLMVCLLLAACQSQHPVAQSSTDLMGEYSPIGSFSIQRRHNFVLPFDASFYIANPVNSLVTDSGDDVNGLFVEQMKEGFSQHFARVFVGLSKERLTQALRSSREIGSHFLIYGYVEQWPNIKPVKLKRCDESDSSCTDSVREGESTGMARITISVYESASGKLVDLLTVQSQRGLAAYVYEDHEGPLIEVVTSMMNVLSEKR